MVEETLGTENMQGKINYLVFILGAYLIMFFFLLGASTPQTEKMIKLQMLLGLFGIICFLVDLVINNNKQLPLDTISYEGNSPIKVLNNWKVHIISSIALGFLIFFRVKMTNQAFIQAPMYDFSNTIMGVSPTIINGFLSGLTAGVSESIVFFGLGFPLVYVYIARQKVPRFIAVALATLATSLVFMSYHFWVYQYQISAMVMVLIFGISQCLLAYYYRSMVPLFTTHFANNFAVSIFNLVGYAIIVAV